MLKGLSVANYRSIGPNEVAVKNFGKVNIFIGQNNSGKSNILRLIKLLGDSGFPAKLQTLKLDLDDYYDSNLQNEIRLTIEFDVNDAIKKQVQPISPSRWYITYLIGTRDDGATNIRLIRTFLNDVAEEEIRKFVSRTKGISGGSFEDRLNDTKNTIKLHELFSFPKVVYLDEYRKLVDNKSLRVSLNGIINFSHTQRQENQKKLNGLNDFVSLVLNEKVEIKIPDIEKEIELVMYNDKHFYLSSFGTGIQQVILIGLHLVAIENSFVCIDEPELNLHPSIQRAFLKYISENTSNRYFISTHSNSFLDYEAKDKKLFHTKLIDKSTAITECDGIENSVLVLKDLGIRASEILQTNGIVWVEGPSDRIYIKKWLEFINPDLVEGFHFTFQYYGGTVLKHYCAVDEEFKDFVNLLFINQNSYIVVDSDMSGDYNEELDLSENKRRIISEFKRKARKYWVTKGREIENYLSNSLLSVISEEPINRDQFAKIESYCNKFHDNKKIAFAKIAVGRMDKGELNQNYDLKEKISELAQIIKGWNN